MEDRFKHEVIAQDFEAVLDELKIKDTEFSVHRQKNCSFCGMPAFFSAQFMLNDDVWLAANGGSKGLMHIGCVEKALGRPLNIEDFKNVAINLPIFLGFKMGVEQVLREVTEQMNEGEN